MRKIVLILFLLISSSFSSQHISDEKKIKHTLLKYNHGIIYMGKSGETQFFKEFVKKDVAIKLQVWFESWKFSNLTYLAQINNFKFSPITYNEDNATIKTMENWTFSYVSLATKKIALEPMDIFYEMQYTLKKDSDNWMITGIKILEEKVLTDEKKHYPGLESKQKSFKEDIATH